MGSPATKMVSEHKTARKFIEREPPTASIWATEGDNEKLSSTKWNPGPCHAMQLQEARAKHLSNQLWRWNIFKGSFVESSHLEVVVEQRAPEKCHFLAPCSFLLLFSPAFSLFLLSFHVGLPPRSEPNLLWNTHPANRCPMSAGSAPLCCFQG